MPLFWRRHDKNPIERENHVPVTEKILSNMGKDIYEDFSSMKGSLSFCFVLDIER